MKKCIMTKENVILILKDLINAVETNDTLAFSFNVGSGWASEQKTIPFEEFEANLFVRTGNSQGQGGVVTIGGSEKK